MIRLLRGGETSLDAACAAQVAASASEQVTLNVGGFKFTTTVSTLRNAPAPSLFNAMFSGRHTVQPDEVWGVATQMILHRSGMHVQACSHA